MIVWSNSPRIQQMICEQSVLNLTKLVFILGLGWVGLGRFKVGLELRQWAIADGLGFIPKDDLETCHRNFDQPRSGWLLRFGTPRGTIWMGTYGTLHPQRILHAPVAISLHDSFCQAIIDTGPSGQELSTLTTGQLRPNMRVKANSFNSKFETFYIILIFFPAELK